MQASNLLIDGLGISTFGGVISGVGSGGVGANVVKNGIGTANLNNSNSYIGLTTINNGILLAGNANAHRAGDAGRRPGHRGQQQHSLQVNSTVTTVETLTVSGLGFGGDGQFSRTTAAGPTRGAISSSPATPRSAVSAAAR